MKTISALLLAIAALGIATNLNAGLEPAPLDLAAGRSAAPVVIKFCGRYRHRHVAERIARAAVEATPEAT